MAVDDLHGWENCMLASIPPGPIRPWIHRTSDDSGYICQICHQKLAWDARADATHGRRHLEQFTEEEKAAFQALLVITGNREAIEMFQRGRRV